MLGLGWWKSTIFYAYSPVPRPPSQSHSYYSSIPVLYYPMKIIVSGSSGTIGTRLCERLLADGHEVMGIDWVKNKWQKEVDAITQVIDMRDEGKLQATGSKLQADLFIHLAANARVYELVEDPDRARDNVSTLFNALEFCRKNTIKRFIFSSSRESYGNIKADKYEESMARIENCESPYTASKIAGEAFVEAYHRCYDMDHITFRFSNVYGMYDDSERVVPLFIRRAKANEPLTIFGKDKCLDFTYIDDCVSGIVQAIEHWDTAKNTTYNLAYGEGTTIVRVAERVKELLGSTSEITIGESRRGEVIRYIADISKAKKAFGFEAKVGFEEGIQKAVEWYGKNS